jgi:hypothetical protein
MTTDDYVGYLVEATVCQDGHLVFYPIAVDGTSLTITDEAGCDGESKAKLYTVEKHGYSDPVSVPWPE